MSAGHGNRVFVAFEYLMYPIRIQTYLIQLSTMHFSFLCPKLILRVTRHSHNNLQSLRSVAGLVIQATGRTEFDDGLRTGVLLGVRVSPGLGVVVRRTPFQTKFQFCQAPRMGGIKLQLLCGVRIELAVGALPYLARNPSRSLPVPRGGT